jgi:hypothetical protein
MKYQDGGGYLMLDNVVYNDNKFTFPPLPTGYQSLAVISTNDYLVWGINGDNREVYINFVKEL